MRSRYLVLDWAVVPWETSWCYVSQPPVNNTALLGSLSWD